MYTTTNKGTQTIKEMPKEVDNLAYIKEFNIDCSKYGNSKAKIRRMRYIFQKQ